MPHGALEVAKRGAEKFEPLLPDGTRAHFAAYGGLYQVATISAMRLDDLWRARELLCGPAWEAVARVGEGQSHRHIFFGPTNVRIRMDYIEQQAGEISEALRLADDVDISGFHRWSARHLISANFLRLRDVREFAGRIGLLN